MEEDEELDYLEEDNSIQEEIITEIIDGEEVQIEESTSIEDGHVKFVRFDNSDRAETRELMSDGNITYYLNVALEYFNYRCAISGELLKDFGEELGRNLSGEHVVPLCAGGHDRVENVVPSVLKYNILKNGYNPLEWWTNQKDENGKSLYSPYRLLKLLNYMTKALEARKEGLHPERFREVILDSKTALDDYIAKIEETDEREEDNNKRKIISSTETAEKFGIVEFEDNEEEREYIEPGNIPTLRQQQDLHMQFDEVNAIDIFLQDALRKIEEEIGEELKQEGKDGNTLWSIIEGQVRDAIGIIPVEIQVRNQILEVVEDIERKYSVADELLVNTDIVEYAREHIDEPDIIKQHIENYIKEQKERIQTELELRDEELYTVTSNRPNVFTDKRVVNRIKLTKEFGENWQELLERDENTTEKLVMVLKILDIRGLDISKISQRDTIEIFLDKQGIKEEREDIIRYLYDEFDISIDGNWPIGSKINHAKTNNIDIFKGKLEEYFQPEYVEIFLRKQIDERPIETLVNILKILDTRGLDISKILQNDTIETFLDKQGIKEEREEIIRYLYDQVYIGIDGNWPIGSKIHDAKKRAHIDEFTEKLGEHFPLEYVGILLSKKRDERPIETLVDVLNILHMRGVDFSKIAILEDTIEKLLDKQGMQEEKNDIIKYLHDEVDIGIDANWKIGVRINNARSRHLRHFTELLNQSINQGTAFTEAELKKLLGRKNQDKVEELLQAQERYRQAKAEHKKATAQKQEAEQENEEAKAQRAKATEEGKALQEELQSLRSKAQKKAIEEVREK